MMQAQVRGIEANDIPDWPNWVATHPFDELQWFTVSIGTSDSDGEDLFQVAVASPRGINARRRKEKFVGLVVDEFKSERIEQAIRDFVATVQGTTWEAIAEQLSKVMRSEYHDYR